MKTDTKAKRGGIGFCSLLALLFIGLKLTHQVTWSWWAVTAPLWLPTAMVIGIMLIISAVCLIIAGIAAFIERRKHDRY